MGLGMIKSYEWEVKVAGLGPLPLPTPKDHPGPVIGWKTLRGVERIAVGLW